MNSEYNRRYLTALESIASSLKAISKKPPLNVTLELPFVEEDDTEGDDEK